MDRQKAVWSVLAAGLLAACGDGGSTPAEKTTSSEVGECNLGAAATYDGSTFEQNARDELALIAQLKAMNKVMKDAEEDLTRKPTRADLLAVFEGGAPSLKSVTTDHYAGQLDAIFSAFEGAAGVEAAPANPPTGKGGKFGAYIFDQNGLDLRQAMDKGLYGAALYHHAYRVVLGAKTAADVDKVVAIFGTNPGFPGDSDAAKVPNPDVFSAQYAERRDRKDAASPGHYLRFKEAAIQAQAAARAGDGCKGELDKALRRMLKEWELSSFATVVFYMNDAAKKLTAEPATVETSSGGLHGANEGAGFIHGFKGLPAEARVITDAQIDELLSLLDATPGSTALYRLVTDGATEVPRLQQVARRVAEIYGFSAEQSEAYKTSYLPPCAT